MSDIIQTIQALPELISLKPAPASEISDAERQLGLRFADEYKEYVGAFGAILADGVELTGIAKAESRNVVAVTERERTLNPDVPGDLYVVENTGIDGVIVWQNEKGLVFRTAPHMPPMEIAGSLAEYIASALD
jgi:hypothetical protein